MNRRGFVGTLAGLLVAPGLSGFRPKVLAHRMFPELSDISIKDFGAVGDGFADDTGALQTAMRFAIAHGIKTVRIPAGTYRINQ